MSNRRLLYVLISSMILCASGCNNDKHNYKAGKFGSIGLKDSAYSLYYVNFKKSDELEGVILWREKPGSVVVFGQNKTLESINGKKITINDLNRVNFIGKNYIVYGNVNAKIKYEENVLRYKKNLELIPILR